MRAMILSCRAFGQLKIAPPVWVARLPTIVLLWIVSVQLNRPPPERSARLPAMMLW